MFYVHTERLIISKTAPAEETVHFPLSCEAFECHFLIDPSILSPLKQKSLAPK